MNGRLAREIEAEKRRTGLSRAGILKLALAEYLERRPGGSD